MKNKRPDIIELLAPARDAEVGIAAIDHGADAVYIGAPSHGARSAAANSIDDLARLADYAHRFDARVYATVNTLIYNEELRAVERMIADLYKIGIDALIVQDMAVLQLDIPPIDLHASTQCDIRTPEKARFLANLGFSRLVLPRELSLEETKIIADAVATTEIEAFVHGALCVSYSGDCQAGCAISGRSANRGECPQICRLPYDLLSNDGRTIIRGGHFLSLRDLNRLDMLEQMMLAGVNSFKIEGRLKDMAYVKNVVAAYRRRIDDILRNQPALGTRASCGSATPTFTPDTEESFNRGFTTYFSAGKEKADKMASIGSPKWVGRKVATVVSHKGNCITVKASAPLANGDGLGYFDSIGEFCGFRVNRVEGNRLIAATSLAPIKPGTTLLRNRNKLFDDAVGNSVAGRHIAVAMTLRLPSPRLLALDITDERGNSVTATITLPSDAEPSRKPQGSTRRDNLAKTGGTIYKPTEITDLCGDMFIPISLIADLRRRAIELLDRAQTIRFQRRLRMPEKDENPLPQELRELTYHDNVANKVARKFYTDRGAEVTESALEVMEPQERCRRAQRVMTTRYCLRRELGECLKDKSRKGLLPSDNGGSVMLQSGAVKLRVEFDCHRCGMNIYHMKVKG